LEEKGEGGLSFIEYLARWEKAVRMPIGTSSIDKVFSMINFAAFSIQRMFMARISLTRPSLVPKENEERQCGEYRTRRLVLEYPELEEEDAL